MEPPKQLGIECSHSSPNVRGEIVSVPPSKALPWFGSSRHSLLKCPSNRAERRKTLMNFNQYTIVGFIGKDAEIKFLPNGTPVVKFSVATKRSWKDDSEDWKEKTQWHNVVVIWNRRYLSTVSCF
jgi:hypothetical protein